ncbi:beta strand repeat-containing protein [Nonlabens xylanidelens]|uniref:beta strand repeat-containing protein n=1 Tax=Nonlabens xylanidelens TaxID=191564 RepID=UPI000CF3A645|nr:hypothetical protein [Nonlabens xylanidelens]PQJ20968.1 hypothetical protein BST94_04835 [Nonlabens xylanidelens]
MLDITVTPVTDDLEDLDENLTTSEDVTLTGDLFDNLTDADSSSHTLTGATVDANGDGTATVLPLGVATALTDAAGDPIGDITVNADGSFEFDPAPNYNGPVPTVGYDIVDNNDPTDVDSSMLDITVTPVTDDLEDLDENLTTSEDVTLTGDLFDNLTDADSSSHTLTGATVDANGDGTATVLPLGVATALTDAAGNPIGDITVNADGSFEFDPAPNYNGPVPTVGYDIVDNNDPTDVDSSMLDITVTPVTDDLEDLDENLTTSEDVTLTGDLFDNLTDADSSSHTLTGATVDANGDGTATVLPLGVATGLTDAAGNPIGDITVNADGSFEFDPAPNYNGPVPTVGYDIVDNNDPTDVDSSMLDITVTPVTDDLEDLDENLTTSEDVTLTGDLFDNLTDADSSSHTLTGATVDANGDGTATVLPLGVATALTDAAGDPIGDITVNADGSFEFDPAPNYNGPVPTVGYDIVDNNDPTDVDSSMLDITVTPVTDDLEDLDENLTTSEDVTLTGDLFDNLTDADSSSHTLTGATVDANGDGTATVLPLGVATGLTDAAGDPIGDITVNADGSFEFDPAPNYNGPIPTVGYDIVDNNDPTDVDSSMLDITVTPVTDDLEDLDENLTTSEDVTLTGDLFDNLTDADSSSHTLTGATVDANGDGTATVLPLGVATALTDAAGNPIGDITVNADGSFEFDPAPNYNGPVPTVGYDIVDNNDPTDVDSSMLDITVTPVTDDLEDLDENLTTSEDVTLTGDLFDNLTDADSSSHTLTGATVDANGDGTATVLPLGVATGLTDAAGNPIGDITVNADGSFEFDPAPNYNGPVPTVGYDIVDNNDPTDVDSSMLDITVTPVTDDLEDLDENLTTSEDVTLTGDLFDNLTDADSSSHTLTGATVDANGDGTATVLPLV